jgi:hypothetical protein
LCTRALLRSQEAFRYLADQEYAEENIQWCERNNIRIFHERIANVREPYLDNNPVAVTAALKILLGLLLR